MKRVVPFLTTLACCIAGAQVRFDAPRLGYVYDSEAKAIRQIGGVAGAAAFDGSVDAGGSVERAWIGGRGYAVVQGKQDSVSRWVDWTRGGSETLPDFQAAAVSASGRYFALATADGALEIRDGSSAQRMSRTEGAISSPVTALAVSDDGGAALIGSGATLQLWTSGQEGAMRTVWSGDGISSAAFLGDTRDFAALDAARGRYLTSRGGSIVETVLALPGASALASVDNRRLAIGGDGAVLIVDLASGEPQSAASRLTVDGVVEGFARVNAGGDVLQVRLREDSRTVLLETAEGAAPQIEFVVAGGGIR